MECIKKIGIECENLEGTRFGVGQTMAQMLEQLGRMNELAADFRFYLYFKKEIPKDEFLNAPIFVKKIIRIPFLPPSFNIFYHILLPWRYWRDRLNGFFFPSYMMPAFFFGRGAVILTSDIYHEVYSGNLPFKYRLSYRLFCRRAAKRAKKVITISEFSKKELMKFYAIPENRITVNPWGLDKKMMSFRCPPAQIAAMRQKYGLSGDFLIAWGQAFPRRHVREAMLAFEKIAPAFKELQFFVACVDKYNPMILEDLASRINRNLGRRAIIYANYIENREELLSLVKASRLAIYISSNEAMGLPPLEALALGVPSLVAQNGITQEIFGQNAFFVKDLENIDEIANKMKEGILDQSNRLEILKNASQVVNKFSWENNANKFIKILDEIF